MDPFGVECKRFPKCDVTTVWVGKGSDFDQKVMLFSKFYIKYQGVAPGFNGWEIVTY